MDNCQNPRSGDYCYLATGRLYLITATRDSNFISLFYSMVLPDFTSAYGFLLLTLVLFIIITFRYFLVAGMFYLIFHVWFRKKYEVKKINKKDYKPGQFRKEIKYSLISSLLFALAGTFTVILWQKGFTKVYTTYDLYGWWYLPVSLVIYMLLQETYYYWTHRWMHIPAVFRRGS